ncbi:MAG TPA: response regulator transcription factor [Planctomycetes bacterium]|nr:response regulator transcription factor [Planctomycetota bacterium]
MAKVAWMVLAHSNSRANPLTGSTSPWKRGANSTMASAIISTANAAYMSGTCRFGLRATARPAKMRRMAKLERMIATVLSMSESPTQRLPCTWPRRVAEYSHRHAPHKTSSRQAWGVIHHAVAKRAMMGVLRDADQTTLAGVLMSEPQSAAPVRVLLVDDHRMMIDLLVPLLEERIPGLRVVETAADGNQAVASALKSPPDLMILDIDIPGLGPFEAARMVMKRSPQTKVMFLSGHQHDQYIERALDLGARGYVVKSEDSLAIVDAVERVLEGGLYYSPSVLARLTEVTKGKPTRSAARTRISTLTERESQVLILLAKGESVKRIATILNIAYKTVDKHKVSLMKKLDIHDRVELCRFAVRERIIEA